jgi:DNA-binding beta-propeller fold protein YncE
MNEYHKSGLCTKWNYKVRYRKIKRVLYIFILTFSLFVAGKNDAYSDPFAVVANEFDRTINTIDLGTNPPTVFGPFLGEQLGGSGLLQDVATTPDGNFALVGNSELQTVFLIDVSDPTNPTLADSLTIGLGNSFQEIDLAIAPNGEFALAVGGIGDLIGNQIAIIDLTTFSLTTTYTLTTPDAGAECIAIAPVSQTVIVCDTFNNRIIFGPIDPSSGLTSETTLPTGNQPLNATISPDGQTVLVANFLVEDIFTDMTVSVFRITGPGMVEAGTTTTVSGLPGGQQSIAFSPDGDSAFVDSVAPRSGAPQSQLSELLINGAGDVSLGAGVANLLASVSGAFFGVDVVAVTPDGLFALVGNNFDPITPSPDVSFVNLSNFTVSNIDTNSNIPVGIDIIPAAVTPTPTPTPTATPTATPTPTPTPTITPTPTPTPTIPPGGDSITVDGITITTNIGDFDSASIVLVPDNCPDVVNGDNVDYPFGFIAFAVNVPVVGQTINVTFDLPPGADPDAFFKANSDCSEYPGVISIGGGVIVASYTDGGQGDLDGVANGVIVDPGGPAVFTGPGGRGNGGCAIAQTVQSSSGVLNLLIPIISVFVVGYRMFRRRNRNEKRLYG